MQLHSPYRQKRSNAHNSVTQAMVANYTAQPQFQSIVIATGDMVEFGAFESSWQTEFFNDAQTYLRQRMRDLPFITCLGNHELYEDGYTGVDLDTQLFGKYFPYPFVDRRYWSFDYGPVHVTIIDQYPPYYNIYGQGLIDATQLSWIESDLSSTDRKWKLVILHEPGWSLFLHPVSGRILREQKNHAYPLDYRYIPEYL